MAAKKADIMELKQLLLLKQQGLSNRSCERLLSIHRNTINEYVRLFKASGFSYEKLLALDEQDLKELFPKVESLDKDRYNELSNQFNYFSSELKKPGCTRLALWQEYQIKHPGGYGYTQFNEHYNSFIQQIRSSGKLEHKAGDELFVDYTGKKLQIIERETGEVVDVEVFVGILPCSQYTYAEATMTQQKHDFILSMNNCLSFMGGTPKSIKSDNLKSAVTKASKYEPILNRTFREFGLHYNSCINPTRAYSPQDKALVESAVKLIYQRVFYPLSKMQFFSLIDLNKQMREELDKHNHAIMKTYETSRYKQFHELEKNYLGELPSSRFELREYALATVQKMGYVYLSKDKTYYSVPFQYIGKKVEVQYTTTDVEIYIHSQRISHHLRSYRKGFYSTHAQDLSSSHKFFSQWSPVYFKSLAEKIGPNVTEYISRLIESKTYPEVGYKQSLGILHLARSYETSRLEKACIMALEAKVYGYHLINNILQNKTDQRSEEEDLPTLAPHENIRGPMYYQ